METQGEEVETQGQEEEVIVPSIGELLSSRMRWRPGYMLRCCEDAMYACA